VKAEPSFGVVNRGGFLGEKIGEGTVATAQPFDRQLCFLESLAPE
jgi:hypothetical protein